MDTLGLHHLGLSVSNLSATTTFFTDCLGWSIVKEIPSYPAVFVKNESVMLTLWQTLPGAAAFDRRQNVGLHHFAIRVVSEEALDALFERARAHPGVVVDFAPEPLGPGPSKHCMLFEPSGVRVEFVWTP